MKRCSRQRLVVDSQINLNTRLLAREDGRETEVWRGDKYWTRPKLGGAVVTPNTVINFCMGWREWRIQEG